MMCFSYVVHHGGLRVGFVFKESRAKFWIMQTNSLLYMVMWVKYSGFLLILQTEHPQ